MHAHIWGIPKVPKEKMQPILQDLDRLWRTLVATVHCCASVLGRVRSLLVAFPHLRLYSDVLARHIACGVHCEWDAEVPLEEDLSTKLLYTCEELAVEWLSVPCSRLTIIYVSCAVCTLRALFIHPSFFG